MRRCSNTASAMRSRHTWAGQRAPAGLRRVRIHCRQRLVRSAARTAGALHAQWLAVYVETPKLVRLPQPARDRILQTLRVAAELGAETANLSGESVAATLIDHARQQQCQPDHRRQTSSQPLARPLRCLARRRADPSERNDRHLSDQRRTRRRGKSRRPRVCRSGAAAAGPAYLKSAWRSWLRSQRWYLLANDRTFRAHQYRDGLSARDRTGGGTLRARAVRARRGAQCRSVRFPVRAAAILVRGFRHAVCDHVCGDADDGAADQSSRSPRKASGFGCAPTRAPRGRALCAEPRAVSAAHDRGAGLRNFLCPSRPRQRRGRSRRIAARRGRTRSRIRRISAIADLREPRQAWCATRFRGTISASRSGPTITARKPACTRTRSPARLRCICR